MSVNRCEEWQARWMAAAGHRGCWRPLCGTQRSNGEWRYCAACRLAWLHPDPFGLALANIGRGLAAAWRRRRVR